MKITEVEIKRFMTWGQAILICWGIISILISLFFGTRTTNLDPVSNLYCVIFLIWCAYSLMSLGAGIGWYIAWSVFFWERKK